MEEKSSLSVLQSSIKPIKRHLQDDDPGNKNGLEFALLNYTMETTETYCYELISEIDSKRLSNLAIGYEDEAGLAIDEAFRNNSVVRVVFLFASDHFIWLWRCLYCPVLCNHS